MIEHVWTVICSKVVKDDETRQLSLFNVFEVLEIEGGPVEEVMALFAEFAVASFWVRAKENIDVYNRGQLHLELETPDGKVLHATGDAPAIDSVVDLTAKESFKTVSRFSYLPITVAGRYEFRLILRVDGEANPRAPVRIPIWVNSTPQPQLPAENLPASEATR